MAPPACYKCRGSNCGCETFYCTLIPILQMAKSDPERCQLKLNVVSVVSLLLAEYLFSFLVLFAFFKQPSQAKLQKRMKLNQRTDQENGWRQQKPATHPEGQIVSLCKTHIWCILRPQSIHSTSLRRNRNGNVACTRTSSLKEKTTAFVAKVSCTYSSGSSVSFFFFSNWSLFIDLKWTAGKNSVLF